MSQWCPAKADRLWDIAHAWVREDGREYCYLCGQEREAGKRDAKTDARLADWRVGDVLEIGGE